MPLAPFHALKRIEAADVGGFLHGLDGLSVHDGSTRVGISAHALTFHDVECREQHRPSSPQAQAAKMIEK
jgi:hypothetical protein